MTIYRPKYNLDKVKNFKPNPKLHTTQQIINLIENEDLNKLAFCLNPMKPIHGIKICSIGSIKRSLCVIKLKS